MKKTPSKKAAQIEKGQSAAQERATAIAEAYALRKALALRAGSDAITRYLDAAGQDAETRTRHILPEVADVKVHPLPSFKDLIAAPASGKTLADVTNEITDHLDDESRYAAPGLTHGLEDFLTWYQGPFLESLRRLALKKIAVCDTLGKTDAKNKIIEAFTVLPSFASQEAYEDYCQRIREDGNDDPTEEIVRQWRDGKPSPFPTPEAFKIAFRRAQDLDAEATNEINNEAGSSVPCGHTEADRKKHERQRVIRLGFEVYTDDAINPRKNGNRHLYSYRKIVDYILDEDIPQGHKFYSRFVEAREIVSRLARGCEDTPIRNSLGTQIKNYARQCTQPKSPPKRIKSCQKDKRGINNRIVPNIGDASSRYNGW